MAAQIVRLNMEHGISRFHCAVCGSMLVSRDEGLTEQLCEHVAAVVDWVDNIIVGAAAPPELEEAMEGILEAEDLGIADGLARNLADTAVVFEFVEPSRGGGHDASSIVIALDFFAEKEGADD